MSVTGCLYRRSGRAQRNPTGTKRVGFRCALPDLQMVIEM